MDFPMKAVNKDIEQRQPDQKKQGQSRIKPVIEVLQEQTQLFQFPDILFGDHLSGGNNHVPLLDDHGFDALPGRLPQGIGQRVIDHDVGNDQGSYQFPNRFSRILPEGDVLQQLLGLFPLLHQLSGAYALGQYLLQHLPAG